MNTKLNITVRPVADLGSGAVKRANTKVFLFGFPEITRAEGAKVVALALAGLGDAGPAKFSGKCGCSCGCSPGFNVRVSGGIFDIFVTKVEDAAAPAELAN
jgi:hypothetical protein